MLGRIFTLALVVAVGCGHAGLTHPEGWQRHETAHFNLYAGNHHDAWRGPLENLERAHAALTSSYLKSEATSRIDVIFIEEAEFEARIAPATMGVALEALPAGPIGADGLLLVSSHVRSGALARHLVAKTMPDAPCWFQEGLAEFLRSTKYLADGGAARACVGQPLASGVQHFGSSKTLVSTRVQTSAWVNRPHGFVPLPELFALTREPGDEGVPHSIVNTGRAIIDFLHFGDGGRYRAAAGALMAKVQAGAHAGPMLSALLPGAGPDELLARIRAHDAEVQASLSSQTRPRGECPIAFPIAAPASSQPLRSVDVPPSDMKPVLGTVVRLMESGRGLLWYRRQMVERASTM
jgi:hypothetical protein